MTTPNKRHSLRTRLRAAKTDIDDMMSLIRSVSMIMLITSWYCYSTNNKLPLIAIFIWCCIIMLTTIIRAYNTEQSFINAVIEAFMFILAARVLSFVLMLIYKLILGSLVLI